MRKLITMLAILVAGIVSAQEVNPPTLSFQFTCEEIVIPTITLNQSLLDAGWVLDFSNGEAGEIVNSSYPGYVIVNTSDDEVLTIDTFSDEWIVELRGDEFYIDSEPVYLGEVIAAIVDDFNDTDTLSLIVAQYFDTITPNRSVFTLEEEGILFELDLLQHAIIAWSGSPSYTLSYGIEYEDESAYVKLTDKSDSSKYVSVEFQYNVDVDFVNNKLIFDVHVSTLAHESNSTGLNVTLPIPGTDIDSVIAYLEAVRELVTPLSDVVVNEYEEEEIILPPAHVETRRIVTEARAIAGRHIIRIAEYMFVNGVKGDEIGTATVSTLAPNSIGELIYEGTLIEEVDSEWFLFNEANDLDEGPFDSIQEALQTLLNLTGGIVLVENPPTFRNIISAEILSDLTISISVSLFYYDNEVQGDQFGETGIVSIPQTLLAFGAWTDDNLTLSYVQGEGTYGITDSSNGYNRTGLTLQQMAQIYINLR